jgi:hypothetical protein
MGCPYAFIFGKPNEGPHSIRFGGYAVVDSVATILVAILITYIWNIQLWKTIIVLFVLGEILHYIFGVQTAFLTTLRITVQC